ncbi:MAG: GAF domain-containing protein [Pseudolysinimonas sp.]|uniref:GAF domain-containing protein n=1 Tax=Pseudolysinimonas sp. TaxID=2680009 RepID=UPI0032663885
MLERIQALVAPLLGQWFARSSASWRSLEIPRGTTSAHSPGVNADRVALVGSGVAVGYGAHVNDLALGGHLARQISARTGRGATVETLARIGMRISGCLDALRSIDLTRIDALVVTIGGEDVLRLMRAREFRTRIDEMLNWVTQEESRLAVLMVEIPDIPSIMRVPRIFAGLLSRHGQRLNQELRAACASRTNVHVVPFAPQTSDLTSTEIGIYRSWALLLAPAIAEVLNSQLDYPRDSTTVDEMALHRALEGLKDLDSATEDQLTRIAGTARDVFGVDDASILFVDRDRQWNIAFAGANPLNGPRGDGLGSATVHNGKILVIPDLRDDVRFADRAWMSAPEVAMRFFAGFPIEASNGQRVGALCIVDGVPRNLTPADGSLLGDLARQVESSLRGREHGTRS